MKTNVIEITHGGLPSPIELTFEKGTAKDKINKYCEIAPIKPEQVVILKQWKEDVKIKHTFSVFDGKEKIGTFITIVENITEAFKNADMMAQGKVKLFPKTAESYCKVIKE
jgi:hypothetical protein